ncbi:MAG TPA: ABC-F family ATP-binding cassette domain-containing protein [Firmicutes bacterium]|nr:ABC-F family ATP-binding cassette domain-containing protein [Candidatus Fermentithermobacillaceae bacterium]
MPILTVNNLTKYFGAHTVFKDVSFTVAEGERVCVIGRNGEGKTTLLRVLAREMEPDGGGFAIPGRRSWGYLSQDVPTFKDTVLNELLSSRRDIAGLYNGMRDLEAKMEMASAGAGEKPGGDFGELDLDALMDEYGRVTARFEALDGYSLEHKAKAILAGLGFTQDAFSKETSVLSGGEKLRLALAKLLLLGPDLLLLDEPTNHLDLAGVEWLESFLRDYPGAALIVSHDRYFIDRVATKVVELSGGEARVYSGNYSAYQRQREMELKSQAEEYERQQALIARTKAFIQKWKATPRRKKQAESREKMLERLEIIEKPKREKRSMGLRFEMETESGDEVLELIDLGKAFPVEPDGTRTLWRDFTWQVRRGDRIALIGPNGCGKTTLLKCVMGMETDYEGEIRIGQNVITGYFSQGFQDLCDENTVLQEVRSLGLEYQDARDLLGRFLFSGDEVEKQVKVLSGGERNRLTLAKLVLSKANFLLLDEPTNHLDMASREALESAIKDFPGTLLFASHDRYFIDTLATHLWIWQDGVIHVFKGSYSEYRAKVENGEDILFEEDLPSFVLRRRGSGSPASVGRRDGSMDPGQGPGRGASPEQGSRARGKARPHENDKAADDKDERQKEAALRKALILELSRLESEIEALELRREELIRVFSDPSSYESPESLPWKEYDSIEKELQLLYGKWEALVDQVAGTSEDKEKTSSQA